MTNTEPSEWFAGLSRAYEEVRDFLMTPLQWVHLDLTASEKNALVVCVLLAGALVRASVQHSERLLIVIAAVLSIGVPILAALDKPIGIILERSPSPPNAVFDQLDLWLAAQEIRAPLAIAAFMLLLLSVIIPVLMLLAPGTNLRWVDEMSDEMSEELWQARGEQYQDLDESEYREHLRSSIRRGRALMAVILLNILFTTLIGAILLLLNWATS